MSVSFAKDTEDFRQIFVHVSPLITLNLDFTWDFIRQRDKFARTLKKLAYKTVGDVHLFWQEQYLITGVLCVVPY